jgi:uncharacterized membrane protein
MDNPFPRRAAANPTQYNIDAIAKLEHEALDRRTPTERVSDAITKLVGNIGFLLAHLILISGWSLVNLHVIPGLKAFDPFPFGVLALVVSSESVFLTIFVLITQSRMARQSERRSHLDLQASGGITMPSTFRCTDYRRAEGPYDAGGVVADSEVMVTARAA